MRSFFRSFLVAFLTLCATQAIPACGGLSEDNADNTSADNSVGVVNNVSVMAPSESDSDIGTLNQGLDSTNLGLKLPLPAGYNWRLHTEVGGYTWCDNLVPGPGCDSGHTGNSFYSLDFGRFAQDVVNPNNKDGVPLDDQTEKGTIDVLAAASGFVLNSDRYPLVVSGCRQWGTACQVHINHGGDYITSYLHFKTDTIKVVKDQWVAQGQSLGKMGNTGTSTNTHLHFQVRYGGNSSDGNLGLEGVALEGKSFKDYKFLKFYPSTNGFAYNPVQPYGANPRVCSNGLTLQNGDYACNRQSAFQTYRQVFIDIKATSLQRDVCYKVEIKMADNSGLSSSEWCVSGPPVSGGYYLGNSLRWPTSGAGKVLYYMRAKDKDGKFSTEYLPAPMAVAPFTFLKDNVPSPPTITTPANWSVIHLGDAMRWNDALSAAVTDHDLYFWYWNGSAWQPFGFVNAWANASYAPGLALLPTNKWIAWFARSCNSQIGCSGWSPYAFFGLVP